MMKKLMQLGICIFMLATAAAAQTVVTSSGATATTANVPYVSAASSSSTTLSPSPISVSGSNVGIGTTTPAYSLDVNGQSRFNGGLLLGTNSNNSLDTDGVSTYLKSQAAQYFYTSVQGYRMVLNSFGLTINNGATGAIPGVGLAVASGNVGIGTTNPTRKLHIAGDVQIDGSIYFGSNGTPQSSPYSGNCGADYAESVDVTGDRTKYAPGDVLVIDPTTPGQFLKSNEPYSTMAAGIYSTKPGYVGTLREANDPANANEIPMAMLGRVPTKVTAENGPIQVGDLLVTSSTVGYAMKGTDRSRLTGAVIGKALSSLDSGTGTIMVLVTLQ
jgi:hypothetical protein